MKRAFFKNLSILILVFYLVLVKTDTSEAIYEEKYSQIIWSYLEKLCALGPRNPGSKGYIKTIELNILLMISLFIKYYHSFF